jgi:hypothetical protein
LLQGKGNQYSGSITIAPLPDALHLTLVTRHPPGDPLGNRLFPRDAWELGFDFRPASGRLLPDGAGAFNAVIFPDYGIWHPGLGARHDLVRLSREEEHGGSRVTVSIPWKDIKKLTGAAPADFTCSARLNLFSRTGDRWRTVVSAMPFTGGSDLFGNGSALFVLDPERAHECRIPVVPADALPAHATKRHEPIYVRGRVNAARLPDVGPWPERAKGFEFTQRQQPFTLERGERLYTRTYGCNGVVPSARVDFFATSFALVPTGRRKNEDWALFNDRQLRSALTRRGALNFCAPGDRRDENGTLWLHFPRQPLAGRYTIGIPCLVDLFPSATTQHINTDGSRRTG